MPKDHSSKARGRELAERSRLLGRPVTNPCQRCSKRDLPCILSRASGRCAECCQERLSCSLMPSALEFDKAASEHQRLQLELAQLEADSAAAKLRLLKELAAVEAKERALFRREEESIREMEERERGSDSSPRKNSEKVVEGTGATVFPGPSQSEPNAADLGWLQTDENDASSSFDLDAFYPSAFSLPLDSFGDRPSPILRNSQDC